MDAIKLYSVEADTFKTFQHFINQMYKKGVSTAVSQVFEGFKPEMVQYVGTAVVYIVGTFSCIYRGMSVGTLYAFLSRMGSILAILISWLNIGLQKAALNRGLQKLFKSLSSIPLLPKKRPSAKEI